MNKRTQGSESIGLTVGYNVRNERKRLDLTLRALANRAGLPAGMLSKIFHGPESFDSLPIRFLAFIVEYRKES